ncbi:MAG: hypothetical protein WA942_10330, partial [Mycolicibacter sinensis]
MTGSTERRSAAWTTFPDPARPHDIPEWVAAAYLATHRGPHSDALGGDDTGGAESADRTGATATVA